MIRHTLSFRSKNFVITDYHAKYYAYELTRQSAGGDVDRLSQSLFDVNPHQIELERTRNKQRKELFDRQDEIDERQETLIGQLENKLNQSTQAEDLFTIDWHIQ